MPKLLELCEKYFHSQNLYEVLNITKSANDKQVRKAYHQLSLLVHPDRVDEDKKIEATEKFKVLGKVHSILSDKEKRAVYDDTGTFDEDDSDTNLKDWTEYWRMLFKKITVKDINDYEKQYKGSEIELKDLKRAYVDGKGDMDYILEAVPFTNTNEEPRLRELIDKMIEDDEVPAHRAYTHETPKKKERRKRKWDKEAEEAARLDASKAFYEEQDSSLASMIAERQYERGLQMDSFFDALVSKYGGTPGSGKKKSKSVSKKKN